MGVSAAKIQSLVRGRAARTACKAKMAKVVKAQASRRTDTPRNGRGLCGAIGTRRALINAEGGLESERGVNML